MAQFAEKQLLPMTAYQEWLPHDKRFFEDLDVLIEIHQLSAVKKDRRELDRGHDYPVDMLRTRLSTRGESPRARLLWVAGVPGGLGG